MSQTIMAGSTLPGSTIPIAAVFSAFGAVLAALIIGAVTVFGHKIAQSNAKLQAELSEKVTRLANKQSSENSRLAATLSANTKLAEFRQSWLNNLREDMAQLISLAVSGANTKGIAAEYSRVGSKIELQMNPADPDYGALRSAMDRLLGIEYALSASTPNDEYIAICQKILKREWAVLSNEIKAVASINPFPPES